MWHTPAAVTATSSKTPTGRQLTVPDTGWKVEGKAVAFTPAACLPL
jgi:hypothetical protein